MTRSLLIATALLIVPGARAGERAQKWPDGAPGYRFHMIGNAHLDPVWLWPWSEGLAVVHSTFRAALDRMNETPDVTFTASSAQFYDWVASSDPAMLAEIRHRVDEGRWAIVGGWWVEPDVNMPSGEALVRQGLYGQRTFAKLLGRMATVGYNPDSFGHPGTLPQILHLQGMDSYVMMRPQPHEKKLPGSLFWWEAPDGTRVLTYRIPFGYGTWGEAKDEYDPAITGKLMKIIGLHEPGSPGKNAMAFYGLGDHGGGPAKVSVKTIESLRQEPGAPVALFSTPDRYFAEIRNGEAARSLPVVKDDLQHHAVGCYTAHAEVKRNNRAAEAGLVTAEKMAVLGSAVANFSYPRSELTEAWKRVLFMQFHDSLAGTALPEHYQLARDAHGRAMDVSNQTITRAANQIAWGVPAEDPKSQYLVVFNPHAWDATLDAEYDLYGQHDKTWVLEAQGPGGTATRVPHQWSAGTTVAQGRRRLVFRAQVPAFGYRQFRLRADDAPAAPASAALGPGPLAASGKTIENEHLRLHFRDDGTVALFDKDAAIDVFAQPGAAAVVLDDPSDTWSHGARAYGKELGRFKAPEKAHVVENGPVRARVRTRAVYGASALEIDWILYAGSRVVEMRVVLDWHEHLKMIKFSFPTGITNPVPTYEIAYGHIVRQAGGDEDPGQRWLDVGGTAAGKPYGLTVLNDAKYGYSVQGSDLRVSVARGAVFAHHEPSKLDANQDYQWQDQGRQAFRMLLVPHRGSWQDAAVPRLAEQLTAPVPIVYQGIHRGHRPFAASFLSVDAPDIAVAAIKLAEDNDDIIVRCYETAGRAANVAINLALAGKSWRGRFRPGEIKTLRVPRGGAAVREVNLLE